MKFAQIFDIYSNKLEVNVLQRLAVDLHNRKRVTQNIKCIYIVIVM